MSDSRIRQPRRFWVPARVLLIAVLFGLMAFAISMFLGIVVTVVWGAIHHAAPHLSLVYRWIAPAVAGVVALVTLTIATYKEIQHYRQDRVLAGIERAS
jgi:uncharacterized BrkB/YihY/UPF0761 family membrane protein